MDLWLSIARLAHDFCPPLLLVVELRQAGRMVSFMKNVFAVYFLCSIGCAENYTIESERRAPADVSEA